MKLLYYSYSHVLVIPSRSGSVLTNSVDERTDRAVLRHTEICLERHTENVPVYMHTMYSIHTARRHPRSSSSPFLLPTDVHATPHLQPSPAANGPVARSLPGFRSSWTRELLRLLGLDFYMGKPIDLDSVLCVRRIS